MSNILDQFENVMPYFSVLFGDELSFALTNTEKYLNVWLSKKLPLQVKPEDRIPDSGAVFKALTSGQTIIKDVGKEAYGIPFKSFAIPIFDESKNIIGVFVAGKSLDTRNQIIEMSTNLSSAAEQMASAIQHITEKMQAIASDNSNCMSEVDNAISNVNGSNEILDIIRAVSKQTNLLGLNAAIESARAGEFGKGFSVVAEEIRKLSNSSNESVGSIENILNNIKISVNNISNKMTNINNSIESEATTLEEINASIEELAAAAQQLQEFSKKQ